MRKPSRRQAMVASVGIVAALGIGVPAAIAEPASITGTVTADDTGDPLSGVCVFAYNAETFEFIEQACTDDSGAYQFAALESGVGYRIEAQRSGEYLGEWAFDKRSFDEADIVTAPGTVDFGLARGEIIEGRVTAEDTGEGLESVCLFAWTADTFDFEAEACTDEAGHYALTVRPDTQYKIEAKDFSDEYIDEWFDSKTSFNDADIVTAPAVADFILQRAGHLQGTVTLPAGTAQVFPSVQIWSIDGDHIDTTNADESGAWALSVRPGTYKIHAGFETGLGRWALDAATFQEADSFTVESAQTVTVDITLPPPSTIEGRVTDAQSGDPIEGVCVDVNQTTGFGVTACTDADGRYTAADLGAGAHKIHFNDFGGTYVSEWHNNALRQADARAVQLDEGGTRTVNAALKVAGHVTGRIVDAASGEPLPDFCAIVREPTTTDFIESTQSGCTDDEGRFTIDGIPAGTVLVYAFTSPFGGFAEYPGAYAPGTWVPDEAAQIKVRPGAATDVGDIAVRVGGVLRGRVTNQDGEPLEGIHVSPSGGIDRSGEAGQAITDENGEYELRGVPGPLVPGVLDPEGVYGVQWSGGASDPSAATPVPIHSGETTTVDWVLKPGSVLVGTVVDSSGKPAQLPLGFELSAYDLSGELEIGAAVVRRADATFEIRGLPDGPILLRVLNEEIWYDQKSSAAKATQITLASGETTEITFKLPTE